MKIRQGRKWVVMLLISILCIMAIISLLPVSFDSLIYGNELPIRISELYAYRLGELFVYNHPEYNEGESYNFNSYTPRTAELSANMEWQGRYILTKASIMFHDVRYTAILKGKRYWINRYTWKVEDIYRE